MKQNNDFKTEIKKEINKNVFFPGLKEYIINNNVFYSLPKPILIINNFCPTMKKINLSNINQNSNNEIFSINFNCLNEFISKPFITYSNQQIAKIYLISNLYKIFIINIPNNVPFSIFDFYSLTILLCPDFPKVIIKKLNILINNFNNLNFNPENLNENIELKLKVNIKDFFCIFSIYFLFMEFFFEIDKLYSNLNSNQISIKELKKLKQIKKEYLYSSLILCNTKLINEYSLNTINTIEDCEEILDKNSDIKISYSLIYEKTLKNKHILNDLFNLDKTGNEYIDLINNLN